MGTDGSVVAWGGRQWTQLLHFSLEISVAMPFKPGLLVISFCYSQMKVSILLSFSSCHTYNPTPQSPLVFRHEKGNATILEVGNGKQL